MKAPNTPQRVVLVTASVAVLALAFYPPFFPRNVRSGRFDIQLAAVTLATAALVLALRGLPNLSLAPAGWKRLWVVLSLIYLSVVIGLAWHLYPANPYARLAAEAAATGAERSPLEIFGPASSQPPSPESEKRAEPRGRYARIMAEEATASLQRQRRFVIRAALLWVGPVLAVYVLGVAWCWVYRGFQSTKKEG